MREQLKQYVDLLFAGIPDAEDIKQEILQNTLDRYDDLIAQGKTPEAAYQLAISGIGDIHEILGNQTDSTGVAVHAPVAEGNSFPRNKLLTAIAIACFILCPIPVLVFENSFGVCLLLVMVAAGVALLTLYGKENRAADAPVDKRTTIKRMFCRGVWICGVIVYLTVSFFTGDWHITWLIFPILGCICGLGSAIADIGKSTVSAVIRIVVFSLLLVVLIPCMLSLYYGFSSYSGYWSSPISGDLSYSGGSVASSTITDVEIEWVNGSITLQTGNTDSIEFQETLYSESTKPMVWKQSGGKLIIQFSEKDLHFGIFETNSVKKDLVITIPETWVGDSVTINSVSAEMNVTGLSCEELDLNNVSGTCSFKECRVKDLTMETVSGSIEYSGTLTSLDCDSVSADCTIYADNTPASIDMDGVSSDLILYLPEDCGFRVSMDSLGKKFTSDFSTTVQNGSYLYGDGSCRITADSVSGEIIIRKRAE